MPAMASSPAVAGPIPQPQPPHADRSNLGAPDPPYRQAEHFRIESSTVAAAAEPAEGHGPSANLRVAMRADPDKAAGCGRTSGESGSTLQ
jgi:hypothetical protein